jgi:hypothetical protein
MLSHRVPQHLRAVLNDWQQEQFDCERIPLRGRHRRLRWELRNLAAKIMAEMAVIRSARLQL